MRSEFTRPFGLLLIAIPTCDDRGLMSMSYIHHCSNPSRTGTKCQSKKVTSWAVSVLSYQLKHRGLWMVFWL